MVSVILVMGVSGCGKTTIGAPLAERLGWRFAEADLFHSPANVAKMRSGTPLDDEDRRPWLADIARWIDAARASGEKSVIACSALKRRYRDLLVRGRDDVRIVYLQGAYDLIAGRMTARPHHYMPVSLLQSQFEALEEPGEDERPIVVPIAQPPGTVVDEIVRRLKEA